MDKYYIGIDIGGTKINIVLISEYGYILYKEKLLTKDNLDEEKVIENIVNVITRIKTNFIDKNILGIGIGSAGIILYKEGIIKFSPNIGWRDFGIKKILEDKLKLKVVLDNDANATSWGIFYLNYKNKYSDMICLTLGTGIGAGLIFNKKLFRGKDGTAGEIGHMTYLPSGFECTCGNKGCFERYIGTRGFIEIIKNNMDRFRNDNKFNNSKLYELEKKLDCIFPKDLQDLAGLGDKFALYIWREYGEILGILLASVINLLNIEVIAIAGGIANAKEFFIEALMDSINRRAFSLPASSVNIIFKKQRQDIGAIGAGLLLEM